MISFHYAVNNGRFRCCDSVTLTIKSILEPYYFLKHKTKPFNFHLPWFSGLCDYKRAKSDLLNGVDHSVLFSAERSEASNTLVPGTRGFGREGPKYSAVQQKTCDVSCCRHRVFSFPVIYSGYVAGRSATYTESKRSRSQYRRLYCCLNGNTGLKAFLYVAFEWEKGILGVWEARRIPLPSHAQIPFSDLSNVCQQARGLLLTALTTTCIC